MAEFKKKDFKELMQKYGGDTGDEPAVSEVTSIEYQKFKASLLPKKAGWYEQGCAIADKIISLSKPKDTKKWDEMQEFIDICHLDVTPSSVQAFAFLGPGSITLLLCGLSYIVFNSAFFAMFFGFCGLAVMFPLMTLPKLWGNAWRLKASNQMVLCVFYIVTYMRHTSNMERAIGFAADHLEPPLSLDMRKIVWDVETEKYDSIKDSLENYLETWRKYNSEFIEAMHLIESSLYEGAEERRIGLLDKSLDVILTETYEKMLHYAHNLQGPIMVLHMMGVILPVLGLVILPLVVSFMGGVQWYHISAGYNVILPLGVFYFGKKILSSRPNGYGGVDISKGNPKLALLRNFELKFGKEPTYINPIYVTVAIVCLCFLLAFVPLIAAATMSNEQLANEGFLIEDLGIKFLEYRLSADTEGPYAGKMLGPYGIGAGLFSFFIPLGLGFGIGLYFLTRSEKLMGLRNSAKRLETEFASALFQLGNRLGDGIPAERAFGEVADIMKDTTSGNFFRAVSTNIMRLGLGVDDAIFHPKYGALLDVPSSVISSSMKVLVESVRKGPTVAAEAMLNISRYIKEIHRVDERLKDLLSDVLASMNSQISFMAPAISGIVIGITSMITGILGKLRDQASQITSQGGQQGSLGLFTSLFGDAMPAYYFQIVVGIYVVQIVIVLSVLSNQIENGQDELNMQNMVGKNVRRSTLLYVVIAAVVMVLFNMIAGQVASKTGALG